MNENEFATGSVPVMVAARIYGKDASGLGLALYLDGYQSEKLQEMVNW